MEDADRHGVLVAVRADSGGKRRRLIGVILNRVKPGERRRVRTDHVHVLAQVVHLAIDIILHRPHALISIPKLTSRHGVRAPLINAAVGDVRKLALERRVAE